MSQTLHHFISSGFSQWFWGKERDYSTAPFCRWRSGGTKVVLLAWGHQPAGGRARIPGGLTSEPILFTAILFDSLTWGAESFPPKSLAEETGQMHGGSLSAWGMTLESDDLEVNTCQTTGKMSLSHNTYCDTCFPNVSSLSLPPRSLWRCGSRVLPTVPDGICNPSITSLSWLSHSLVLNSKAETMRT